MDLRFIVSSPSLELSGANILVANLLERFQRDGAQVKWIVTGHEPTESFNWMGGQTFPSHRLPPTRLSDIRGRQTLFRKEVVEFAPSIYLPTFDFDMVGVAPSLPFDTSVVLIVHSDDPVYYDFVAKHGTLCNAIVGVSRFITNNLKSLNPHLKDRIVSIPFGVKPPEELPVRGKHVQAPLEVAYCGRISFRQKRVQDLAEIITICHRERLGIRFHIAGTGPDEEAFFQSIAQPLADGTALRLGFIHHPDVLGLLGRMDVLLMTSDFEGLPVVLLEAMSRGCVPVVSRTASGVDEVILDGVNGYLIPIGDCAHFVRKLEELRSDLLLLQRLRKAAFDRIRSDGFNLERAANDYKQLFESVMDGDKKWAAARNGRSVIPSRYTLLGRLMRKMTKTGSNAAI